MFEFLVPILIISAWLTLCVWLAGCWISENIKSHTPEWREEKLIDWLKRPLPTLGEEYRKKILASYPSEEWNDYPYLMVDAISYFEKESDEVIRWAIYYSTPDKFRKNDEEYLRLLSV